MSRAHPAGPRHGDVLVAPAAPARPDAASVLALDPGVWPRTARRDEAGVLRIGGADVRDLAQRYATPLVVFDEEDFRARARAYRQAYDDPQMPATVFYAGKAFLTTTLARWVVEEGLGLDVCSAGELAVAQRAGVPADRILFHGNNKSSDELVRALDAGVGRFVLDSMVEIARLAFLAEQRGVVADVLVRVTVGVEAHTHEFVATAHEDQKFGFSLAAGAAEEAVRRVVAQPALRLRGLHSHIGSQIFDAAGFDEAARRVAGLAADLQAAGLVARIEEVNLGGGMGIAYVAGDDPLDVADMAGRIRSTLGAACRDAGIPVPHLAVEPGRALVGPAGVTLYEVGTVKPVDLGAGHLRTYVSVDGGMSDNIRTALYDADYTVTLASRSSTAPPMLVRIVGKHCESGDILVRDAWLPDDLAPGDLVALAATGAYCRAMASSYNYLPRPAVVAVSGAGETVLLRRETEEDLLALDPGAR